MTYADRLSRAGVPVELHMYPRAYHGFYRATNARVTRQAEHDTREEVGPTRRPTMFIWGEAECQPGPRMTGTGPNRPFRIGSAAGLEQNQIARSAGNPTIV